MAIQLGGCAAAEDVEIKVGRRTVLRHEHPACVHGYHLGFDMATSGNSKQWALNHQAIDRMSCWDHPRQSVSS